jgi:hypothetical protein
MVTMVKKLSNFFESLFALGAIIAIISISAVTVLALNPKEYQEREGSVAGAQDNEINRPDKTPLVIENNNETATIIYSEKDFSYTFQSSLLLQEADPRTIEFVKVNNPNNYDVKLLLKPTVYESPQTIENMIIRAKDHLDTIILVEKEKGVTERYLTIPRNSSRTLELEFEAAAPINFPINFQIGLV